MKIKFCLLIALFISGFVQAQTLSSENKKAIKAYEKAIDAFDSRNNEKSLELLQKAIDEDSLFVEAHLLSFEVYNTLRDVPNAEKSLENAILINPDYFPNAWFFLGALEMRQGKYREAKDHFTSFINFSNVNPDMIAIAESEISNCIFAIEMLKKPVDFDPKNMGANINSPMPEYYPGLSGDDQELLYTRLTNDPRSMQGKNEDFYYSRKTAEGWNKSIPLNQVNSEYNEGAPTISADGRTLIFTACEVFGDYGTGRSGEGSCDLFYAVRTGNNWSQPKNLGKQINTANWETQPSLSADGRTLYFVRGRPTRQGVQNQDIFVTQLNAEGFWDVPKRLPTVINTPKREESVQIHPDGKTLYFSSDGHVGMGGLDIFLSRKDEKGEWSVPENLGYPINTHNDENSLLVSASGKVAYFASDREGGFGDLDLYSFELPEQAQPTPVTYAKGIVYDKDTKQPLQAKFELTDVETGEVVVESYSDQISGEFLVSLPVNREYALSAERPGYLFYSANFNLEEIEEKSYALEVPLSPVKDGVSVVLRNVFFDTDKYELKPESKIELNKLITFLEENVEFNIELSGHTDNQGAAEYNKILSENRAKSVKKYLTEQGIDSTRIDAVGYGDTQPISDNETEAGRAENRRTEFKLLK